MPTDVSTSLPQLDLPTGSTITVTLSDAAAKVTQLNVHGFQADPDDAAPPLDPVKGAYLF
jgi:hypothetical protein